MFFQMQFQLPPDQANVLDTSQRYCIVSLSDRVSAEGVPRNERKDAFVCARFIADTRKGRQYSEQHAHRRFGTQAHSLYLQDASSFLRMKKTNLNNKVVWCYAPTPRPDYEARFSRRLLNNLEQLGFFNVNRNLSTRLFSHFAPREMQAP